MLKAREVGHRVVCAISIHPFSDESRLFHFPNSWVTKLQAEAMGIRLIEASTLDLKDESESQALTGAFQKAKDLYAIEGLVHGGIASEFQKRIFGDACSTVRLELISPLWHSEPREYMNQLMKNRFEILITSVSAMGLDEKWLGRPLDYGAIEELANLSSKYGFNLTFEGGEAETVVTDCPLFGKRLAIAKSRKVWDGQRGIFEILEASLVGKDV